MPEVEGVRDVIAILNVIGLPAIIAWWMYDRRRLKNEARAGELGNTEVEATLPNRVRSSSVVTLEAELLALSNSFDRDRKVKDETIQWLTDQLRQERAESSAKDQIIDRLQSQVHSMQGQMRHMSQSLEEVQRELDSVKSSRRDTRE